jgi:hypothetical protein
VLLRHKKRDPSEDGSESLCARFGLLCVGGVFFGCLRDFAESCRGRFAALLARFLVMLVLSGFLQNAGFLNLLLEPPEGAVDRLAGLNLNLRHISPLPSVKIYRRGEASVSQSLKFTK